MDPARQSSTERWREILERSLDCVHCGLCLPTCPTYRETGREISSPRGRIYLLRGVAEGRIPLAAAVAEEAYLCLGCRACETACPSGVRFGSMLELSRAEVEVAQLRSGWARRLEGWALRSLVPHRRRLRLLFDLLAAVQRLRLDRLARPLLPRRLRELHALLPPIPPKRDRRPPPEIVPARGERRGRVGLLTGCIAAEAFGHVNRATLRVLARNGFEVVVPRDQGCCGALHAHGGDPETASELARRNVAAFGRADVEAIVVNSAGCGAAMREANAWIGSEAEAFAAKVRDVSEFLDAAGLQPPGGRFEARVCYDDPCHLVHGQGVAEAPRNLLRQIPGLKLEPHDDPAGCCGAAGIYNLTHREMSNAVLDRKLRALAAADPDVIATGNPGCLMQLRAGAARFKLRARVVHPIELLDAAYGPDA
ncbi:MAG: heterodisulfide reductase-related iron-sulfur binding cluster [Myxococcales bacterium]|nr:heterodisulfide reductase-related iron-sulfur binding cluster [Myxococcales bacterium]